MSHFIVRMLALIALVCSSFATLAQDSEPDRTGEYIVLFNGFDDPEPPEPAPKGERASYPPYEPYPEPLGRKQRLS